MAAAHPETAVLAAAKLKEFVEHDDQNLKYLGLLALAQLQVAPGRPIPPAPPTPEALQAPAAQAP
eukprot:5579752-Prymnesium_polylepis.1